LRGSRRPRSRAVGEGAASASAPDRLEKLRHTIDGPLRLGDRVLGDVVEATVLFHHRRRLSKLGHRASFSPPRDGSLWATADPPPRTGNTLEVLIDGDEVLPAIAQAIRSACSHVHIAGWSITPPFELTRSEQPTVVRELLADVSPGVDVRVILWAGAPVPVIRPDRRDVRRDRRELASGSRVKVALDAREHLVHCHHEKLVVIDDDLAFVGGLDLTDRGGDRYDSRLHPDRGHLGWHDLAFRIRGPLVGDVARHFAARWRAVTGDQLPQPAMPSEVGETEAQFVRTVPEGVYPFAPRGDFRILESYVRALRSAQRLIYIENQFLWAPEIVSVLAPVYCSVPPLIENVLVLAPRLPSLLILKVPALIEMVCVPPKVLAPLIFNRPAPDLSSPPAPDMTPAIDMSIAALPSARLTNAPWTCNWTRAIGSKVPHLSAHSALST